MARRRNNHVVLREATPAERRVEFITLVLGGAYSLLFWAVVGLQVWSVLRRL